MKIEATFAVKSWDEQTYEDLGDGAKLTRSHVVYGYEGDIEGEGKLEYLMAYRTDGSATFVGLQRVVGRLGGRSGSFLLQHIGTYESGVKDTVTVIPGSGTEELAGLKGEGVLDLGGHADRYPIALEYSIDEA